MTLKSIVPILQKLLGKDVHQLKPLVSLMNPNEMPRTMFVTTNVLADVECFDETLQGERLAKLRAWLDGFIEGDIISVSEDPDDKQADTMLCRVHDVKDEFWSIRVTEPSRTPGIRSIGAFTDRDEFLSINWNFREGMDFDEEVADAQQIWKDFFGEEMPHFGDCLDEYLTNFKT